MAAQAVSTRPGARRRHRVLGNTDWWALEIIAQAGFEWLGNEVEAGLGGKLCTGASVGAAVGSAMIYAGTVDPQ